MLQAFPVSLIHNFQGTQKNLTYGRKCIELTLYKYNMFPMLKSISLFPLNVLPES